MKVCSKCGSSKDESEFYVRKRRNEMNLECKECVKVRVAKRRKEGWDLIKDKQSKCNREYRKGLRLDALMAYGGLRCACCGETEYMFLTLDHINNDGAEDRVKIAGRRNAAGTHTYKWLKARDYPPGYQVLCMNCNFGKRMNNGVCPHLGRCNDYPEREYGQVAGSATLAAQPRESMKI